MRDTLHAYLLERPGGATPRELLDLVFTQPLVDAELGPRFLHTLLAADPRFAFRADQGRWIATSRRCCSAVWRTRASSSSTSRRPAARRCAVIGSSRSARCGSAAGGWSGASRPWSTPSAGCRRSSRVSPASARTCSTASHGSARPCKLSSTSPRTTSWSRTTPHSTCRFSSWRCASAAAARSRSRTSARCGWRGACSPCCAAARSMRWPPTSGSRSPTATARSATPTPRPRFSSTCSSSCRGAASSGSPRRSTSSTTRATAGGSSVSCRAPRSSAFPNARIYRFFGADARLLYVGKAKSLRRRVASYASNATAHSRKTLDLIRHIRSVEGEECGSELEAALCEAEEIRRLKPPYNRLGKHLPRIAFIKLTAAEPFPRLFVTARLAATQRSRFVGPFNGRESARQTLAVLARLFRLRTCSGRLRPDPDAKGCFEGQIGACSMPCRGASDEALYRRQVDEALAVFDGRLEPARAELERRRQRCVEGLRFEAAERAERELELLRRLARRQNTLRWLLERRHCVVVQRDGRGGAALLYVAVHGRLVERHRVRDAGELAAVARRVEVLRAERARPIEPEAVDATVILAAWLRERGERDGYVFPLDTGEPIEGQLPGWTAALESLLSVSSDRSHADLG